MFVILDSYLTGIASLKTYVWLKELFPKILTEHFEDLGNRFSCFILNFGEHLSSQYCPISLLCVISKLLNSIINKEVVNHHTKNNALINEQYEFCSSQPTADVLTFMTYWISKVLYSMLLTTLWHRRLLNKLSGNGICKRVYEIMNFFLSCGSMKVVCNGSSLGLVLGEHYVK